MKITELIAELESDFPTYAKDIDKVSVKYDVIQQLRLFGLNIAEDFEQVLQVKNSKATLPDNFKSLTMALKLKPCGHHYEGNEEDLIDSYIYRERIETPRYFDEVNQEYVNPGCSTVITESINYKKSPLKFYYNYEWLSLVKGVNKTDLSTDCLNLHPSIRDTYPHKINITGNTINTNFSEGQIYIKYKSLPIDEDGEIIIPQYTTGEILAYIIQYVKVRIAEKLIANNLNPIGISQLYPMWKNELPMLKRAARRESLFYGLNTDWHKKIKILNARDIAVFNLPNLNF